MHYLKTSLSLCFSALFALLLCQQQLLAQPFTGPEVVVNEYYNSNSQNDEWTEILILKDNLDMTGWFFGDNNAATDSWQTKLEFNNIPLWQNLRRGTYIIITHAQASSNCNGQSPFDTDKSDGYLKVCSKNTAYFSGGSATTLDIASGGDFIHLVNPAGKHIHAIGHDPSPGGSVTGSNCQTTSNRWRNTNSAQADTPPCGPYVFLKKEIVNPTALGYVSENLDDYNIIPGLQTEVATNGKVQILVDGSQGHGNNLANKTLIRRAREPFFIAQDTCYSSSPSGNRLTWEPPNRPGEVDPNPLDGTQGYLILRGIGNIALPTDGKEYRVGDRITLNTDTALVVGILTRSFDGEFVDANPYPRADYRVIPYRYRNATTVEDEDRGRAYNTTEYVKFSSRSNGFLPITGSSLFCIGDTATFSVPAAVGAAGWVASGPIRIIGPSSANTIKVVTTGAIGDSATIKASVFGSCGVEEGSLKLPIRTKVVYPQFGPLIVCIGDTFDFGITARSEDYIWSYPAQNFSKIGGSDTARSVRLRLVRDNGDLTVQLQIKVKVPQTNGCKPSTQTYDIATPRRPQVAIVADSVVAKGFDALVKVRLNGADSLALSPSTVFATNDTVQTYKPSQTGFLIAKGLLKNSSGCASIDSQFVRVYELKQPPNIITPNAGDDFNKTLTFVGYTTTDLVIYNRWGKKAYESKGTYKNDWQGTPGTYYYTASITPQSGTIAQPKTIKGWLEVVE